MIPTHGSESKKDLLRLYFMWNSPHEPPDTRSFGIQKYIHGHPINYGIPYAFCNDGPSGYLYDLNTQQDIWYHKVSRLEEGCW
jgi:hypothetical protein